MRLSRAFSLLAPLAFAACLSGTEPQSYPNIPIESTTFAPALNVDLAASTMQNYRRHIEEHLLPTFEDMAVADIMPSDVATWEKHERADGYAESSIKTWRGTLHLILADAVDEGLRDDNPASRRRGRGKRRATASTRR